MNRLFSILPYNSLNFFPFRPSPKSTEFFFCFVFRFFSGFSSSFYCAIETDLHAFNFYLVTQDCYCLSIVVHFHCIIIFYFVVRHRYDYESNIFLFRILPSTPSTVEFFNSFLFIFLFDFGFDFDWKTNCPSIQVFEHLVARKCVELSFWCFETLQSPR